ncbi:MAG: regulatory protein RecX [Sulfobacillus sp.]
MNQPPSKKTAYIWALRYLAQQELSQEELRRRLHRRHVEYDVAEEVIHQLQLDGSLNDRRVAEQAIFGSLRRARQGPLAIKQKLAQRGIDHETVDSVWAAATGDVDWLIIAEGIKERYDMKDPRQRARCARYLARQGFPSAIIRTVLAMEEPLEKEREPWL